MAAFPARGQNDPIVFAGDSNLPPYEYLEEGVPKGVNVEFLRELSQAIGRPIEIKLTNWKEAQDHVLAGRRDALTLMTPTAERNALYDFTRPTFIARYGYFVRAGEVDDFAETDPFKRRIGVTPGGLANSYFREHHADANLVHVRDTADGMRRLQRREIDAFASSLEVGTEFLRELRVSGITPMPEPFLVRANSIAVPKGNPELLALLDAGVAELKANGTFDRIVDRLNAERVLVFTRREVMLFVTVGIGALVVLALLAAVLVITRRQRRRMADREAQLRATFAGVTDAIISIGRDGKVLNLNQAFASLHGFPSVEAARRDLQWFENEFEARKVEGDEIPPDDLPAARALRGETVWQMEMEVRRRKTGEFCFHGSYNAVPILGEGNEVRQVVVTIHDVTERVRGDRRQALLTSEIDHRARNALAVVQAVVRMTRAGSMQEFTEAVRGRVEALARSHARLSRSGWLDVRLRDLVADELAAFVEGDTARVRFGGPEVVLSGTAVQPVAMILHELATNAAKHGSLSRPSGRLDVFWELRAAEGLRLTWTESGGPAAATPAKDGVGTTVISGSVRQLNGSMRFDWREEGLRCTIDLPADAAKRHGRQAGAETCLRIDPASQGDLAGRRILVVEDDAILSAQVLQDIEAIGCRVVGPAVTLEEALRLAASEDDLDGAVLDINIGGRPSWIVADILKERGVPFLFASGYGASLETSRRNAVIVQKPFTRDELEQALRRVIGVAAA